jgi:hypothetical protein
LIGISGASGESEFDGHWGGIGVGCGHFLTIPVGKMSARSGSSVCVPRIRVERWKSPHTAPCSATIAALSRTRASPRVEFPVAPMTCGERDAIKADPRAGEQPSLARKRTPFPSSLAGATASTPSATTSSATVGATSSRTPSAASRTSGASPLYVESKRRLKRLKRANSGHVWSVRSLADFRILQIR